MNNIFTYCEINDDGIADVNMEIISKGRKLANAYKCNLEVVVIGHQLKDIEKKLFPYGVDIVHIADDKRLFPYLCQPHASIITQLFEEEKPRIALFGATPIGRDITPRVASALKCGLTADCTSLEIGDHEDKKLKKVYKDLLFQIRPAFGGNIIATIINPETLPQMATVREGVMKKDIIDNNYKGKVKMLDVKKYLKESDFIVKIIERHIEPQKINIKNNPIIVAGGFGVGSKENFQQLTELAELLGGEVGASRAAVDAGYTEPERQIGQTGVTVRPKLFIACGISGAVQHTAGMIDSSMIISINIDKNAPINQIADYTIVGDLNKVIPKMITFFKKNAK